MLNLIRFSRLRSGSGSTQTGFATLIQMHAEVQKNIFLDAQNTYYQRFNVISRTQTCCIKISLLFFIDSKLSWYNNRTFEGRLWLFFDFTYIKNLI